MNYLIEILFAAIKELISTKKEEFIFSHRDFNAGKTIAALLFLISILLNFFLFYRSVQLAEVIISHDSQLNELISLTEEMSLEISLSKDDNELYSKYRNCKESLELATRKKISIP